jgi:hypothetical protein
MQWSVRKESLLALKGSRSRFAALGKGKLWLVTELQLTGRERQLRPKYVLYEILLNFRLKLAGSTGDSITTIL